MPYPSDESKLQKVLSSGRVEWSVVESLVANLGDAINEVYDDEDTALSDLYTCVNNGKDALEVTKLFLKHGYDVAANDGFNGAACLTRLCWGFYDHYILDVAELLIDAGADCSIDIMDHDADKSNLLSSIGWKLGSWMTGYCNDANIFTAYYEMVERHLAGKPYRNIRAFEDSLGSTVIKVERALKGDPETRTQSAYSFDGALVFITTKGPMVANTSVEFVCDPYYREKYAYVEDVSDKYADIIGNNIDSLFFQSQSFATLGFSNKTSVSFMSAYYDSDSNPKNALCFIHPSQDYLRVSSGMEISSFRFTSGWSFASTVRIYGLASIFVEINGKYYHVYSEGKNYKAHAIRIQEIPAIWACRLSRTISDSSCHTTRIHYVGEALQWIEVESGESYLYICVDTFEKLNFFRSAVRIEDPLKANAYSKDTPIKPITFLQVRR